MIHNKRYPVHFINLITINSNHNSLRKKDEKKMEKSRSKDFLRLNKAGIDTVVHRHNCA